jgi:hypothetical protein
LFAAVPFWGRVFSLVHNVRHVTGRSITTPARQRPGCYFWLLKEICGHNRICRNPNGDSNSAPAQAGQLTSTSTKQSTPWDGCGTNSKCNIESGLKSMDSSENQTLSPTCAKPFFVANFVASFVEIRAQRFTRIRFWTTFWTPPRKAGQRPSRRVAVTEGNGNVFDFLEWAQRSKFSIQHFSGFGHELFFVLTPARV